VNEKGCLRSVSDWSVWAVLIQYIDECTVPQAGEGCMWFSVCCEDNRRSDAARQGYAASRPWGP
jgi:hypothetical protein